MRRVRILGWLVVGIAACAGPVRPSAFPNLTELPDDPQKRAERLETAQERPPPESRKPLSKKARIVETVAATAAAAIAVFVFHSPNVVVGVGAPMDENLLIDPDHPKKKERSVSAEGAEDQKSNEAEAKAPGDEAAHEDLVPWVKVQPAPAK